MRPASRARQGLVMEDFPGTPQPAAPEPDPAPGNESPPRIAADWFPPPEYAAETDPSARRDFRRRIFLVLIFGLTAFGLTVWMLTRIEPSLGNFPDGPSAVVRAQLRAIRRGDLRAAYGMFSNRYRQGVSFEAWHELVITHWRMFHVEVLSVSEPERSRAGITMVMHLRGADDKEYRARFTVIQSQGHWWVDDLHWSEEPDEHDVVKT